ncbi:MAG: glycoside hydrolase family 15 protein [Planctomycetes bacterium]|nr:glycoside hydrolase family 15 protein [Planctomycetota bacterium]
MSSIDDHAAIGDGRTAALVDRSGAIDWLCWPRFDGVPLFAALLDARRGGHWRLGPTGPAEVERRYLPGTNVLETRFRARGGVAVLTDLMPLHTRADSRRELTPEHELLRLVSCPDGEVELELELAPRAAWGRAPVDLRRPSPRELRADLERGRLVLRSPVDLELRDGVARARVRLRAGQTLSWSLSLACRGPAVLVPLGERSTQVLERTAAWWRAWSARARYEGPYRQQVLRSALALRLLVYPPSGAVVAAPTTSLPERPGGNLNWDYRYCWLRDAALTTRALVGLGYEDEAHAFVGWMLHATRMSRPALRVLYDVFGEHPPPERTLEHLEGFQGARPVRVGNAADAQRQLDVYGEVIDAAFLLCERGMTLDRSTGRMLLDFGRYVCRHWPEPDHGIWEPRGAVRHHVHSRVLCWVALDRLLRLCDQGVLRSPPALRRRFEANRAMLRREVEERGWSPRAGAYTQVLGGRALDASLLLLSWYGFHPADHPRMRSTYRRIRRDLGAPGGLLYRYAPDPDAPEGAFGICSFWAVEHLARGGGSLKEATALFEDLLGYANDVGLYAEEVDPRDGAALGNFPQAFTHVGLINAALALAERARAEGRRARARAGGRRELG